MNKNTLSNHFLIKKGDLVTFLKIMRICIIFLFVFSFQMMAINTNAQDAVIELRTNSLTVGQLISEIEKQTDYLVVYSSREVNTNQKVKIRSTSDKVSNYLDEAFTGTEIRYEFENNYIVLAKRVSESAGTIASIIKSSQQQGVTVTGTIKDNDGIPVIGATIVDASNPSHGTVTDYDGNFVLSGLTDNAVLQVSYVGMISQKVSLNGRTSLNIVMESDTELLEEVVVVGYGTQKKVNVIGSISQISSEVLENRSSPTLSNMLTGQMPGVTVIQRTGQPGSSGGAINIRGVGSFGASPDPLILIDGMPGSINDVRPGDVSSISVLKDASSAAIYGSRAANGVILITTKTGDKGEDKIKVNYDGYFGVNKATELPDFVNSWEWADLYNKAKGGAPTYTEQDIQQMRDGSNPDKFANEKYLKSILGNSGSQTSHDISLNGGNNRNQYFVSYGFLSQDGIVENNNYSRHSARINLINQLSPNLKLTTRLSGVLTDTKEPNVPGGDDASGMIGIIQKAVRFPGIYPTRISTGEWGMGAENHGTPVSWIQSPSFYNVQRKSVSSNINLEYTPVKDLLLSASGAYNFSFNDDVGFKSTHSIEGGRTIGPSWLRNTVDNTAFKSFQAIGDYNKSLSNHNFGVLAGYSWEEQSSKNLEGTRDNFPSNDLTQINAGAASNMQNSGTTTEWALQSIFGRLKYNFMEKYLFELTMRYDGSSKFPASDKYALFPSSGIGWRISEENFFKENHNLNWINNLKLKASAGKLGNQNIGNYPYHSVYNFGFNYPFGNNFQQGAAVSTLVDPTLRWEETTTYDIGFETILKEGLLSADVNYFHRETTDILYAPGGSVSAVLGMTPSVMNTGSLKNSGWEFQLGHKNSIGSLNYNVSANFSIIKNDVISLGVGNIEQLNGMIGNGSTLFVGYPMQLYYGYIADGVFMDQNDIDTWYNQKAVTPNPKAGDIRYKDISGPEGKPDGKVDSQYDRAYLGSRIPKYTYGISLGADYKNFDFSMLMQGVGGVKGMLDNFAGFAFRSDNGNVQRWQMEGAFNPENPVRYPEYPRIEILSNVETPNTVVSSFWVRNASYLRVRSAQLGYTFNNINTKLSSLRLYIQAENPLTWHNFPEGWDPEINTGGSYYPILRTYTIGLNLKF